MSNILVKLLDYSLLPAAVIVVAKFAGVLLTVNFFAIDWTLREYTSSAFAVSSVLNLEDLKIVTAYSDLFMYIIIALFFSATVFRSIYFHNTHASQMVILSLAKFNMLNLLKDSYTIYSMAAGWWLFMVVSNLLIWTSIIAERSFLWVGVLTTLSTIVLTVILVVDVYKEISVVRKHPAKFKWH